MRVVLFCACVMLGFLATAVSHAAFDVPPTPAPLPFTSTSEFAHFDVQAHSRDSLAGFDGMNAQHGTGCQGPPATHPVTSFTDSVFVCNGHVMTAANAGGYGMIALTPSQLLDCSAGCTVEWSQSTERLSLRDFPDVWLTPWADNLTLPFDMGDVDLQGPPRRGVHISAVASQNSWSVGIISDYTESFLPNQWWVGMHDGITEGTNQAAVRQRFRLTLSPGEVRFERLASPTATAVVWIDSAASVLLASDYVVQFAHHSYNPSKDGAGEPGTWHWSDFNLSPAMPFSLTHATTSLTRGGVVSFSSPAPANAYLRFTALCKVLIDGVAAPKQRFIGHPEHASSYFVPIAKGKQSVSFSFAADDWFQPSMAPGCYAQDISVWAKTQGGTPTPTSTQIPATPTATRTPTPRPASPTPTATPTPTVVPSPTPTATPTPTVVPSPTPSSTSTPTVVASPAPTATSTPTVVPSPTPTATSTPAVVPSPTPTATSTPQPATPTPMATETLEPTTLTFTMSATVTRTGQRRNTQTVKAAFEASIGMTVLLDVEIVGPDGVRVHQTYRDNVALKANKTTTLEVLWNVPDDAPSGTYTIKLGVFKPGWALLLFWNSSAGSFQLN
jgi:hypothetical protein